MADFAQAYKITLGHEGATYLIQMTPVAKDTKGWLAATTRAGQAGRQSTGSDSRPTTGVS